MKILLSTAFLCLSGCVTSYPQEIRLLSVEPASSNDIPDFPHRSLPRLALKLNFQSAFDLAAYTHDSYGTSVEAVFCDAALQFRDYAGGPAPSLAWGIVYADNGKSITTRWFEEILPKGIDRLHYHAYLFVIEKSQLMGQGSHPDHSWDLQTDPHDVCVRIGTLKEMFLLRVRSDVMRIPVAVIRAALAQKPVI